MAFIASNTDWPADSNWSDLFTAIKFGGLLTGVICVLAWNLASWPNDDYRWTPSALRAPIIPPFLDYVGQPAVVPRNLDGHRLGLPFLPSRESAEKNKEMWQIDEELKHCIAIEHWLDCNSETEWSSVADIIRPDDLQVIAFESNDQSYAFARGGMVSIQDIIYTFKGSQRQYAVTFWAAKDRATVLATDLDSPLQFGIAGLTTELEIVASLNQQCFILGKDSPIDNVQCQVTSLANWLVLHPDTFFCATNLAGSR